jgi:hypothetical protein
MKKPFQEYKPRPEKKKNINYLGIKQATSIDHTNIKKDITQNNFKKGY